MEPLREPKIQAWSLTPKNTQMVLQTEVAKTLLLSARGPWAVPVSHSRSWTCSELQGPLGSQHCNCELLQGGGYVKAILTLGSLPAGHDHSSQVAKRCHYYIHRQAREQHDCVREQGRQR